MLNKLSGSMNNFTIKRMFAGLMFFVVVVVVVFSFYFAHFSIAKNGKIKSEKQNATWYMGRLHKNVTRRKSNASSSLNIYKKKFGLTKQRI